jgi:hypothetical protein
MDRIHMPGGNSANPVTYHGGHDDDPARNPAPPPAPPKLDSALQGLVVVSDDRKSLKANLKRPGMRNMHWGSNESDQVCAVIHSDSGNKVKTWYFNKESGKPVTPKNKPDLTSPWADYEDFKKKTSISDFHYSKKNSKHETHKIHKSTAKEPRTNENGAAITVAHPNAIGLAQHGNPLAGHSRLDIMKMGLTASLAVFQGKNPLMTVAHGHKPSQKAKVYRGPTRGENEPEETYFSRILKPYGFIEGFNNHPSSPYIERLMESDNNFCGIYNYGDSQFRRFFYKENGEIKEIRINEHGYRVSGEEIPQQGERKHADSELPEEPKYRLIVSDHITKIVREIYPEKPKTLTAS